MNATPLLSFGDLWSKRWGSLLGVPLVWDWTLLVALLVSVFMAGHDLGWEWCWLGPPVWLGLILIRIVVRILVMGLVASRPEESRLWFLGDDSQIRIARKAWPRIAVGGVGPLTTTIIWVSSLLVPDLHPVWLWVGVQAMWFSLIHLIPLPPCDGAWLWRGLLLPFFGLRRAALGATGLGVAGCGLLAGLLIYLGSIIGALCFIMGTVTAVRLYRVIRTGFDPVEDAPIDGDRSVGLLTRWKASRESAKAERVAALDADEDALLDRLLSKVSEQGLPSLTPSERKQLHAISERRRTSP